MLLTKIGQTYVIKYHLSHNHPTLTKSLLCVSYHGQDIILIISVTL